MTRDQLSDNWRRTICRCAFLLFCILPTLSTGYWIFHPQTAGQWEQVIRAELGIPTEIDSVETPGPNVTILRGVRLTDPETGDLFATTQVRVIRGNPNRIVIDYPTTVSCRALVQLITESSDNLVGSQMGSMPWRIEFSETTTISANTQKSQYIPSLVTEGMVITLAQYEDGPAAEVVFRLKKDHPTINLVWGKFHRGIGKSPQFELHTGGNFLPCWLLSDLVPDLKKLGDVSEFEGTIRPLQQPPDRTFCKIDGTFTDIDLANLISPYNQTLSGHCTATVENLVIGDGQIFSLAATILCRRGEIGSQLLTSATTHLGFQTADGLLDQNDSSIEFRNLELICRLDNGRLTFEAVDQGIVALDQTGNAIIGHSGGEDRSLDNLAMFLVQPDATDERLTEEMLAVLSRFHRPAPSLGSGPVLRTADRDQRSNY